MRLGDIPNLRQKAAHYFNNRVKSFFGLISEALPDVNPRLRNFFILYSILSVVYIYWILAKLHFGLAIFWCAIIRHGVCNFRDHFGVMFRNPLKKIILPRHPPTRHRGSEKENSRIY